MGSPRSLRSSANLAGSMPKTKAPTMSHELRPQGSQEVYHILINIGVIDANVLVSRRIGDQTVGRGLRMCPRPGDNFAHVKAPLGVCQSLALIVEPICQSSGIGVVIVYPGHIVPFGFPESDGRSLTPESLR